MSDVLIKGMGVPEVGTEFWVLENVDRDRYLYNRNTGEYFKIIPVYKYENGVGVSDEQK